jgi:aldehyde dehydrogenase (NAD+)
MEIKIDSLFDTQKYYFRSDLTKSYVWRMDQLNRLERMLLENQGEILDALGRDFKTSWFEQGMEFQGTFRAITHAKSELKRWMEPEEAPLPWRFAASGHRGAVYREPYGVCLIIAPFNAPIIFTFEPLIAALSAGNTAIVKSAETTPNLSALYGQLFERYFDPQAVVLVHGGREVVSELLSLPFDFIFFTGSTQAGKAVMRAAAENLTPVLLELGGQNPVLVDETANLEDAAEKIVWGAMAFGGQWCVSPGYVYVHVSIADEFVEACKAAVIKFYGEDPQKSQDFSRIVTERDVERIGEMLEGAPIIIGGAVDLRERYISPTIVYPAQWTDEIMQAEILGPVLPIMTYSEVKDVIGAVKDRPKSLAAYVFSKDEALVNTFLHALSFGGGAVNQTMIQCLLSSTLPFGGAGASGIGRHYGKYGFDSLSNVKSIVFSPADTAIDALLPPYDKRKASALADWFAEPAAR